MYHVVTNSLDQGSSNLQSRSFRQLRGLGRGGKECSKTCYQIQVLSFYSTIWQSCGCHWVLPRFHPYNTQSGWGTLLCLTAEPGVGTRPVS